MDNQTINVLGYNIYNREKYIKVSVLYSVFTYRCI